MIITADHGNAEWMFNEQTNAPQTAHTTNVVPLVVAGLGDNKLEVGRLADLAPTMLDIMNVDIPEEMTGKTLLKD